MTRLACERHVWNVYACWRTERLVPERHLRRSNLPTHALAEAVYEVLYVHPAFKNGFKWVEIERVA
jgi:hypothetical protein